MLLSEWSVNSTQQSEPLLIQASTYPHLHFPNLFIVPSLNNFPKRHALPPLHVLGSYDFSHLKKSLLLSLLTQISVDASMPNQMAVSPSATSTQDPGASHHLFLSIFCTYWYISSWLFVWPPVDRIHTALMSSPPKFRAEFLSSIQRVTWHFMSNKSIHKCAKLMDKYFFKVLSSCQYWN